MEAVAAATIPRGAIHLIKPRSPRVRSVRSVQSAATSGRAIRTKIATRAKVGSIRCRREAGVTVAEIEMNRRPRISWIKVSAKGRRTGTW